MCANHTKSSRLRSFLIYLSILLKLLPQSLNGVSIEKANQFLPTFPWGDVALLLLLELLCLQYTNGFFLLLPCVFFHHRQQSNRSVLHFYRIQTYCSWLAPLLLQLPSLGEEKYTAVSAKHFRDAMFILKAFFGQNIGGSSLTEFIHSPVFVGACAAVKSSRVPVKQTRHAETEKAMLVARCSFHWPLCYDHALVAITDYEI